MNKINYQEWELEDFVEHFDYASNFRSYKNDLFKDDIKGHVAEVGPGNGEDVKIYKDRVEKLDLYEPSKKFFDKLNLIFESSKNFFLKNEVLSLKENTYDTIIYLDVLEHIENDYQEVEKAFNSLKPNGKLIVNVPAFQHLYSNFDKDVGHFRRYDKKSFLNLFKNLNYSSFRMKYFDSLGYLLSLLSKIFTTDYKRNIDKKIKVWDFLIPFSKILDKFFFHLFGKSLIIVITKSNS